jgi:hypothetical protein
VRSQVRLLVGSLTEFTINNAQAKSYCVVNSIPVKLNLNLRLCAVRYINQFDILSQLKSSGTRHQSFGVFFMCP